MAELSSVWASLVARVVKNLPARAGGKRCGFDPCVEDPLEKDMATLSGILA